MAIPCQHDAPPNPSPTSTSHEALTNPSLPKDYKKVVKSLIRRRDISLEVKIDLWKRFAEYEACVDEEIHRNDEEAPVFTNTNATTVGEIGPDVEMPVPWMEDMPNFGSGNGDLWYHGGDGDSGYEGNGSHSVDGVEQVEGDEAMDDVASTEVEENSDAAGESVEQEVATTISKGNDQEKDDGDNSNENGNGNRSLDATAPISGAENIAAITSNSNQESNTDVANTNQDPAPHSNLSNPVTDLPNNNQPSTTFTQVRSDIRSYFATLAERERLLASREKWLASRAEALWRNARVLAEILGMGVDRKERKRVMRGFGGDDGGEEEEEERGRKRTRRF